MWIDNCKDRNKTFWEKINVHLSIITKELFDLNPTIDFGPNKIILNPKEHKQNIIRLTKNNHKNIDIYDHTNNPQHNNNETINVKDHINRTGHNPLIGNQGQIKEKFVDISDIYNTKEGVTTDCLGDRFKEEYKNFNYPSHYLCYISILCRALGYTKTTSKLINIL